MPIVSMMAGSPLVIRFRWRGEFVRGEGRVVIDRLVSTTNVSELASRISDFVESMRCSGYELVEEDISRVD